MGDADAGTDDGLLDSLMRSIDSGPSPGVCSGSAGAYSGGAGGLATRRPRRPIPGRMPAQQQHWQSRIDAVNGTRQGSMSSSMANYRDPFADPFADPLDDL